MAENKTKRSLWKDLPLKKPKSISSNSDIKNKSKNDIKHPEINLNNDLILPCRQDENQDQFMQIGTAKFGHIDFKQLLKQSAKAHEKIISSISEKDEIRLSLQKKKIVRMDIGNQMVMSIQRKNNDIELIRKIKSIIMELASMKKLKMRIITFINQSSIQIKKLISNLRLAVNDQNQITKIEKQLKIQKQVAKNLRNQGKYITEQLERIRKELKIKQQSYHKLQKQISKIKIQNIQLQKTSKILKDQNYRLNEVVFDCEQKVIEKDLQINQYLQKMKQKQNGKQNDKQKFNSNTNKYKQLQISQGELLIKQKGLYKKQIELENKQKRINQVFAEIEMKKRQLSSKKHEKQHQNTMKNNINYNYMSPKNQPIITNHKNRQKYEHEPKTYKPYQYYKSYNQQKQYMNSSTIGCLNGRKQEIQDHNPHHLSKQYNDINTKLSHLRERLHKKDEPRYHKSSKSVISNNVKTQTRADRQTQYRRTYDENKLDKLQDNVQRLRRQIKNELGAIPR